MTQGSDHGPRDANTGAPAGMWQKVVGFGQARQAILGTGVQYNYFGDPGHEREPGVSITAPVGQLDERLPLRGRDSLVSILANRAAKPRVKVVHGLGGCGKTRLALEVANRIMQRGAAVWWISAADESRMTAGMRALARRVGVTDAELRQGDAADLLWRRLDYTGYRWLLVLDNADDPQILAGPDGHVGDGTGWLRPPRTAAGMVMVTSRDGRASSWGPWCSLHRLDVLPSDEATKILTDHAGRYELLGSPKDAEALAQRLGSLPLALKIAGSFLAESVTVPAAFVGPGVARTYSQYLAALEGGQLEAVFPTPVASELTRDQARHVIGRTWELTLDLLTARKMPEARGILRLLACLADAPIPYELLLDPGILGHSPLLKGISGGRLWQILETLAGFGLIDLVHGDGENLASIRLHPLVRDTSRSGDSTPDERKAYLGLATDLLQRAAAAETIGLPEDPASWSNWATLVTHVIHIFNTLADDPDCIDETAITASYPAALAARYQMAQGLYAQVEASQRKILELRMRVLGAEHSDTLAARHALAWHMTERENHAAAETEHRNILAARLRVLGADHPDTLATRHAIAWHMGERGNHAAAESEYRDTLLAKTRVLGADHPDTLATRHAMAWHMAERGDHAAAEAEYRAILTARLRTLGADHPFTLTTRHAIAMVMAERGDHAAAEAEYRAILTARLQVLGADHPDALATLRAIALLIAARGDHSAPQGKAADTRAFFQEDGHLSRCDSPGSIELIRCHVCNGSGKSQGLYGPCAACQGNKQAWVCPKHYVYFWFFQGPIWTNAVLRRPRTGH